MNYHLRRSGTLFETTLFTAIHTGASKISLIGVDQAPSSMDDNSKSFSHFYDSKDIYKSTIDGSVGLLFKGENELVKQGLSLFHEWCTEVGVELEVCSKDSYLTDSINRNFWLYYLDGESK